MKTPEMKTRRCRYGDEVALAFPDAEVLWEQGEPDYQGSAAVIGRLSGGQGRFFLYAWDWGSCSGCDPWEGADLDEKQIVAEIRKGTSYFASEAHLLAFLREAEVKGGTSFPSPAAALAALAGAHPEGA